MTGCLADLYLFAILSVHNFLGALCGLPNSSESARENLEYCSVGLL